jgi:hypothetical protein
MSIRKLYKDLDTFFDKFEDHIRAWLSRRPILYAFVAGIAIVLFWRGIWHIADQIEAKGGFIGTLFSPEFSVVVSILVLLATGLFVSFFVGDVIIISGLKRQKKFAEHAEEEIEKESVNMHRIEHMLDELQEEVKHLHGEHEAHKLNPHRETTTEMRSGGGVQPK